MWVLVSYESRESESIRAMDTLKDLAYHMKDSLLTARIREFGELLHVAWENKKRMAEGITNSRIEEIYEAAHAAGALGGKISGAGGGGFMMFFCDPRSRFAVQDVLRKLDCQLVDFTFTHEGVSSWTIRS